MTKLFNTNTAPTEISAKPIHLGGSMVFRFAAGGSGGGVCLEVTKNCWLCGRCDPSSSFSLALYLAKTSLASWEKVTLLIARSCRPSSRRNTPSSKHLLRVHLVIGSIPWKIKCSNKVGMERNLAFFLSARHAAKLKEPRVNGASGRIGNLGCPQWENLQGVFAARA